MFAETCSTKTHRQPGTKALSSRSSRQRRFTVRMALDGALAPRVACESGRMGGKWLAQLAGSSSELGRPMDSFVEVGVRPRGPPLSRHQCKQKHRRENAINQNTCRKFCCFRSCLATHLELSDNMPRNSANQTLSSRANPSHIPDAVVPCASLAQHVLV